jgi:hypothetical protein
VFGSGGDSVSDAVIVAWPVLALGPKACAVKLTEETPAGTEEGGFIRVTRLRLLLTIVIGRPVEGAAAVRVTVTVAVPVVAG